MAIDPFHGMNPEQREAIAHLDGPLLVVAGAGSGKTRVITHRIVHIIQSKGIRPDRVLAITFTNKAAGEMKERIERLVHLKTPWITTFHSAGLRMLKIERARLGFANEFTIADPDDQLRRWRKIVEEKQWDAKEFEPRRVQELVSKWKNDLVDVDKLDSDDPFRMGCKELFLIYRERNRQECVLDFDDLLCEPVRLLESDAELREKWVARFPYILIDEFQDTNPVQYRLIRLLGVHRNVCATGDPDQAIYGWRGADLKNILQFEKDYSPCRKVLLETNYRSTKLILRAAQAVVERNTARIDKVIRTDNSEGAPIVQLAVDDEIDESWAVAAAVDRMRSEGRLLKDIAVFYRIGRLSRVLEDGLRRRDIPYHIVGDVRFYDRHEIKDLLSYLKLLINPADRLSFARMSQVPKRGVGDRSLELLYEVADDAEASACAVLERDDLLERCAVGRLGAGLRDLSRVWRTVRNLPLGDPVACVKGVIEASGIEPWYADHDPEKAQDRIANIRELASAAEAYREAHADQGLSGFLDHVALVTSADAEGADRDQLRLMTIHAAKGLEFPVVFIVGLEQEVFPLARGRVVQDLEEERRLMYVGITRAKEQLYLSWAKTRSLYGETKRNEPSQFLAEIPAVCLRQRDVSGRRQIPAPGPRPGQFQRTPNPRPGRPPSAPASDDADDGRDPPPPEEPTTTFSAGDLIIHQTFGRGRILGHKNSGAERVLVVHFDQHGMKQLNPGLAAARMRLVEE